MKRSILILLLASPCFAEGPQFRHQDNIANREFQNVYQDLRNIPRISSDTLPGGSTQYIQNGNSSQSATFNVSSGTVRQDLTVSGQILVGTGTTTRPQYSRQNDTNTGILIAGDSINSANIVQIISGGVIISSFTDAGEVIQPTQPSFMGRVNTRVDDVTGDGTAYVVVYTEIYDQNADFNGSVFTAPITGKYLLTCSITATSLATNHTGSDMRIITSNRDYQTEYAIASMPFTRFPFFMSVIADMDTGDTASTRITISGGSKVVDVEAGSSFSGSLIN